MFSNEHDVTAQALVIFHRDLLKELAGKYGGEFTINELRIMNQIIRCSLKGRHCSVTGIHKATGIPLPTVSRSVAHLQSEGWLLEQPDPTDGRKRLICLGPRSLELTSSDIDELADWFNDCRDHGLPR